MSYTPLFVCSTEQHNHTCVSHVSPYLFDRAMQPFTSECLYYLYLYVGQGKCIHTPQCLTLSLPGKRSYLLHVSQSLCVCLTGQCSHTPLCPYQGNAAMHYNMSHNLYLYVLQGTAAIHDCMSQSLHVRLTGKCSHILPYISQTSL